VRRATFGGVVLHRPRRSTLSICPGPESRPRRTLPVADDPGTAPGLRARTTEANRAQNLHHHIGRELAVAVEQRRPSRRR
jgi:hypothetical protein